MHPERVLVYALETAAIAMVVLALSVRGWRRTDRDQIAVAVAVGVACFLNSSLLLDVNPARVGKAAVGLLVWLVLTALLVRLGYLLGASGEVRLALLIFAIGLLALPLLGYSQSRSEPDLVPIDAPGELTTPDARPNVYWLVLDGYARPDMLERFSGFDDGPFVADLAERGFQVSSSSLASYPRTHLSLASTLQMEYVLEEGHDVQDDYKLFAPVVVGRSTTVARFRALGYDTAYGPAGGVEWAACREDLVDVCLPPKRPFPATGELESALLDLTPLGMLHVPTPYSDPVRFAESVVGPSRPEEPFFAFQHLLSPHSPYRYRADCSPRSTPLAPSSFVEARLPRYRTQVRCLNDLTLDAVDRIVERDPTAVIVIQSDHGTDHHFRWTDAPDTWTPSQVMERYGAFNAMRLPPGCEVPVEGQPLVNTFRIVFACIEGTEPDLLDYRGFAVPIDDIGGLKELEPERFEPGAVPSE